MLTLIFCYAVISIVSVVFAAFVISFAWFTLKDKAQARKRARQAVPEVFPETPWLPEEMTAYAQAQAIKRKRQQDLHDREVKEFRAELERAAK